MCIDWEDLDSSFSDSSSCKSFSSDNDQPNTNNFNPKQAFQSSPCVSNYSSPLDGKNLQTAAPFINGSCAKDKDNNVFKVPTFQVGKSQGCQKENSQFEFPGVFDGNSEEVRNQAFRKTLLNQFNTCDFLNTNSLSNLDQFTKQCLLSNAPKSPLGFLHKFNTFVCPFSNINPNLKNPSSSDTQVHKMSQVLEASPQKLSSGKYEFPCVGSSNSLISLTTAMSSNCSKANAIPPLSYTNSTMNGSNASMCSNSERKGLSSVNMADDSDIFYSSDVEMNKLKQELVQQMKNYQGGPPQKVNSLFQNQFPEVPSVSKIPQPPKKVVLEDFQQIKCIGKGSYGKVLLVKRKIPSFEAENGTIYAMKVLKKKEIAKRRQITHTKCERNILQAINNPFIVNMQYAFQDAQKLYMVLHYCCGGELFFHLQQSQRFGEKKARFYAANMVLALEHLHKYNIIYRDLKPENILIDSDGYAKITDFGLSKENVKSATKGSRSFCGTPEYLAPEIIRKIGHGKSVDWWSLGVLIYEMVTGTPPFIDSNRNTLFKKITSDDLNIAPYLSTHLADLLIKLLIKSPEQRLGSGDKDAEEIKSHPWFSCIDWEKMYNKKITPPFVPFLQSLTDTRNFDKEFTNLKMSSEDEMKNAGETESDMWEGFSYVDENEEFECDP